jgi:hypothetical protein
MKKKKAKKTTGYKLDDTKLVQPLKKTKTKKQPKK